MYYCAQESLEELVLGGEPGRLRPRELLSPPPEEGVERLGHDALAQELQ